MFTKQELEQEVMTILRRKYDIIREDSNVLIGIIDSVNEAFPQFLIDTIEEHINPTPSTLVIHNDTDPFNPRDDSCFGTMVCNHNKYDLGDEVNPYAGDGGTYYEDFKLYLSSKDLKEENVIWKYINIHEHSGISLSLGDSTSSGWDSGCLGFMYITKTKVREEYSVTRITSKLTDKVLGILEGELSYYNHYIEGNAYGYTITDKDGLETDSCWGFIGDFDDCLEEMASNSAHPELFIGYSYNSILFN